MIKEITVKSFKNGKLTVTGYADEEFEEVEWRQPTGMSSEPKIGSKGLAIEMGSPERLTVLSIDEHAADGPLGFADSRGNIVNLTNDGIILESNGNKIELLAAGIVITAASKVDINAPDVFINGEKQVGD